MSVTIVYDGSWYGLLTAIFECFLFKYNVTCFRSKSGLMGESLFNETICIESDHIKAERVWRGIKSRISFRTSKNLQAFYLSGHKQMELTLLQYIRYMFSRQASVENDLTNTYVFTINSTVKKVYREKHRMEAFVRFLRTKDDLYYATVQPDFNVLPLIAKHFKDRYADQQWLIFDTYRKYGIYYNLETVTEVEIDFNVNPLNAVSVWHDDEILFQQLWKTYFTNVNIPARKNTVLHLKHMPRRYWKFLIEKQ